MSRYLLLILIFCNSISIVKAQDSCEDKIQRVKQELRSSNPFKDKTALFSLIEPCALNGNAEAQNFLGVCYLNGLGVEKDNKKAVTYILRAANQGYANAQYNLGRLYKYGTGLKIDFNKAIEWFEAGSSNGSQKAAYALGYMYYKGIGVEQDYQKAIYWFEHSTDSMARHFLGLCYYLGYGVPANEEKATEVLLNNPIFNSKTLIDYIKNEQKEKLEIKTEESLSSDSPDSNPMSPEVVNQTEDELKYYPEENIEFEDLKGVWKGKFVQYDWSGNYKERVIPIDVTVEINPETEAINVKTELVDQQLSSTAIWQDETLYLEDVTQTVTLSRLYAEHPKQLDLDYNFLSLQLQKYKYQGVTYLVGVLDSYIPEWKEYGKPVNLVLKPEGVEGNELDEEVILALAEQEDQFIKLYPIPFNEHLTIQYQLETSSNAYVELIDLHGTNKTIIQPTIWQESGDYTYSIPVNSSLPEGLYVIRLMAGDQLYTRMIIKEN